MTTRLPEIKTIYNRLKASAKSRNIPFNITIPELNNISFPISCPIFNIPLKFNRGEAKDDSYSFDRIDSSKPYEIDNLIIVSWKANRLKNNATLQEMQQIAEFYKTLHDK